VNEIISVVGAALAGALAEWLIGARQRRRGAAAEEELRQIKRRSDAPYLALTSSLVQHLYLPPTATRGIQMASTIGGPVLASNRREIPKDCPMGTAIYVVVENLGEDARWTRVEIDGVPAALGQEPDFSSARGLQFLAYEYNPAKHGQPQAVRLTFETGSGVQDTHIYETLHGIYSLKRIDPPMP
jgi:hypothetical protein